MSDRERDGDTKSITIGSGSILDIDADCDVFVPVALQDIQNTGHLFVRKHQDRKLDGKNGYRKFYDIFDTYGLRIFQAADRTPKGGEHGSFQVAVIDAKGMELLTLTGVFGESCKAIQGVHEWGGVEKRIHFDNRDIYPVYFVKQNEGSKIKDDAGHPLPRTEKFRSSKILFIVGDKYDNDIGCCGCNVELPLERIRKLQRDFEGAIYLPDRRTLVGRVAHSWDSTDGLKCEPHVLANDMGAKFPTRADLRIKSILLATTFMLDPKLR